MSLTSPIVTLCLMINILVADSAAPPGYTMNAKSYIVHEKLTLNGQGSIAFKFKTTLSQGLLMYIDGKKTQKRDGNYLLIQLVQSKLIVKLQIGVRLESGLLDKTPTDLNITLGENLNDRMYHYVEVEISKGKVTVMLDHQSRSYTDQRGKALTLASPVYVGGVPVKDFEEVVFTRTYLEEKFVGCISSIGYRHGNRTSTQKYLKVVKTQESTKGCHDQCLIQPILQCKNGGKCLNLFSKENTACDCRGTGYAGPTCSTASQPLHFTSNSYLSYTKTKHYYPVSSKVLIRFKPASNSGILIYAIGKNKDAESLLVELRKRTLVIVSKLPGLKEEVIKMGEQNITDISWRFVQMIVDSRKTDVRYFDGISERRYFRESRSTSELTPPESSFHFQKIYVGGIPPNLAAKSESQFAGCLEDVVINNLDFMKLHRSRSVKSSLYSNGNIDEQCTNEIFDEIKEWSKEREGQSVFENSNHVESGSSNLKSMSGKTKYEDSANSSMWIIIGACVGIVVTTAVVIIVIRVRKNRRRNARRYSDHYLRQTAMTLQEEDTFPTEQKCIREEIAKRRLLKTFSPVRKEFYVSPSNEGSTRTIPRNLNEPIYQSHAVLHHDHPYIGQNFINPLARNHTPQQHIGTSIQNNYSSSPFHHPLPQSVPQQRRHDSQSDTMCSHNSTRYQVPVMVRHDSMKSSISQQSSSFFERSLTNGE